VAFVQRPPRSRRGSTSPIARIEPRLLVGNRLAGPGNPRDVLPAHAASLQAPAASFEAICRMVESHAPPSSHVGAM